MFINVIVTLQFGHTKNPRKSLLFVNCIKSNLVFWTLKPRAHDQWFFFGKKSSKGYTKKPPMIGLLWNQGLNLGKIAKSSCAKWKHHHHSNYLNLKVVTLFTIIVLCLPTMLVVLLNLLPPKLLHSKHNHQQHTMHI